MRFVKVELHQVLGEDGLWHYGYTSAWRTFCMQEITTHGGSPLRHPDCDECREINALLGPTMRKYLQQMGRVRG